jgi:hypothetical protein
VVAYLALFLALGGGSFAVASLGKQDKRVVKRIADAQIDQRAPGLAVDHAGSADSATNAGHADTADHATSADQATSAQHATTADTATAAGHAGIADQATTADHATTADTATNLGKRIDLDISADTRNTTIGNFVLGFWCHADAGSAATIFGSAVTGTGTADYGWTEGDLNGANSTAHQEHDSIPTFSSNANLIEIQNKRAVGQIVLRDGTEVVTVIFTMTSNQPAGSCQLTGTAFKSV